MRCITAQFKIVSIERNVRLARVHMHFFCRMLRVANYLFLSTSVRVVVDWKEQRLGSIISGYFWSSVSNILLNQSCHLLSSFASLSCLFISWKLIFISFLQSSVVWSRFYLFASTWNWFEPFWQIRWIQVMASRVRIRPGKNLYLLQMIWKNRKSEDFHVLC